MSKARSLADLGNAYDDGALSNRNLIINGAMQVAQRGTSTTISLAVSKIGAADRFSGKYFGSSWGISHSKQEQVTDAPEGFLYSNKYTALVAQDYSNALGSWAQYSFENQDITSLQNGNGLKDFTASLWLKSNKTGNVTLSVEGDDYSYSTYVTINTAGTWEYKTVTFPATSLAVGIDYTSDPTGSDFNFKVGLGSNGSWLVDVDDQWNDKTTNRGVLSPQQTNFQSTVNDYLQITGVQLEVGDGPATPFEHRSYGDELARCQRYFQKIGGGAYSPVGRAIGFTNISRGGSINLIHTMRSAPSVSLNGDLIVTDRTAYDLNVSSIASTTSNTDCVDIALNHASGGTAGYPVQIAVRSGSTGYVEFDAEL